MQVDKLSRRRVMAGGVAVGLVAAPFVRSANAAGTLTIGLWDHWVPGANEVQSAIIKEWADKEKVDVKVDFITSQGNKLLLTLSAEATARSGHDIMEFTNWESAQMNAALEPVDDVVKNVVAQNGPIDPAVEYLGKFEGKWLGVPMTRGTLLLGCCSRFDLMKEYAGIDVQALYPAGKPPADAGWTWDAFLAAAEKCHKADHAFGLPLGSTTDTNQWVGALFLAYGAELMDAKGNVTVKTDAVRQVLEYGKRIAAFCPSDAPSWDDASNNKWLLSGKASLIFNPPSAWAVGKRDALKSAGRMASRRDRLVGSIRSCRASTVSGASPRTSRPPRACSSTWPCVRLPRGRSPPARATTSRLTRSSMTSRPGKRRVRPRARSRTIRSRAATRWPASPAHRPRR
jgi:ABC-type glycerol-3-phosphate transport system substrate-binding protein